MPYETETIDDHNENEDPQDDNRLDGDFMYPSVERLMTIANSLEHCTIMFQLDPRSGMELRDDADAGSKLQLAHALCNEFARLAQLSPGPGTTMMLYEGMIFSILWDLSIQTKSKKRYKEFSRFMFAGVAVLLTLSIYLMAR